MSNILILSISSKALKLKVKAERQISEKLFKTIFYLHSALFTGDQLKGSRCRYIFLIKRFDIEVSSGGFELKGCNSQLCMYVNSHLV